MVSKVGFKKKKRAKAKPPADVFQEDLFAIPTSTPDKDAPKKATNSTITKEPAPVPTIEQEALSVSEVCTQLKGQLKEKFSHIRVKGELADFKGIHRSGHLYASIKDDKSQIRVVMWKMDVKRIPFELEQGLEVIVHGKIDFYPAGGSLQIVASHIEPLGIGALQLKFEQLKKKLQKEGLFESDRKRPILQHNNRIALITGRSTAAFKDMLKIYRERNPTVALSLFHAAVQGDTAPAEIISAINNANSYGNFDVIVIARGGGSYEDLFCFNDEALARAIALSAIPIVTGIGHEIDFTIADFVADERMATPSHVAQRTIADAGAWQELLSRSSQSLIRNLQDCVFQLEQRIDYLSSRFMAALPSKKIQAQKDLLHEKMSRLVDKIKSIVNEHVSQATKLESLLKALSPDRVLKRGYAIVLQQKNNKIVTSADSVKPNSKLLVKLADGSLNVTVD